MRRFTPETGPNAGIELVELNNVEANRLHEKTGRPLPWHVGPDMELSTVQWGDLSRGSITLSRVYVYATDYDRIMGIEKTEHRFVIKPIEEWMRGEPWRFKSWKTVEEYARDRLLDHEAPDTFQIRTEDPNTRLSNDAPFRVICVDLNDEWHRARGKISADIEVRTNAYDGLVAAERQVEEATIKLRDALNEAKRQTENNGAQIEAALKRETEHLNERLAKYQERCGQLERRVGSLTSQVESLMHEKEEARRIAREAGVIAAAMVIVARWWRLMVSAAPRTFADMIEPYDVVQTRHSILELD